jgi:lysophospholipase L1-like esterase
MDYRNIRKKIGYWVFLIVFTVLAAEILLRIHNPFPTSVTGDKITLHNNTRRIFENVQGPELDTRVVVYKNSLAFRGPEPPKDFQNHLTILTIGGSTTECIIINEEKTWPSVLSNELGKSFNNLWLNNAGLNGHSTYGHIKLLQDYVINLKPKVCIFLVGCNDVDRPDLSRSDSTVYNEHQNLVVNLARYSKLANVGLNFYRHHRAGQRELVKGLPFRLNDYEPTYISDSIARLSIARLKPDVERYGTRVSKIIALCRSANILPIFITQPSILGDTIDDVTGYNLANFPYRNVSGKLYWAELKLYNDETKRICNEEGVMVMDLANLLPKSSRYFYDLLHFNNAGCRKIVELLSPQLVPYLSDKFPQHRVKKIAGN